MLLHDATAQASVDLFLRNLSFTFPTSDLVGIPGGMVGLLSPIDNDEALVLLIHELEHISGLTFPVGRVLSALAMRSIDLRNGMVVSRNKLVKEAHLLEPHELEGQASKTAYEATITGGFFALVTTFAELISPLLEGFAVIAEMETESADAPDFTVTTAVALEYLYYLHLATMVDGGLAVALQRSEYRTQFAVGLFDSVERQIQRGRAYRLSGDMAQRMFLRVSDSSHCMLAAPYFYGYVFLKRLHQHWRRRVPTLSVDEFLLAASTFVCSVLPLTLINIFSVLDSDGMDLSPTLPMLFKEVLNGALELERADIESLLEPDKSLLVWHVHQHRLIPLARLSDGKGKDSPVIGIQNRIDGELIWSVFDIRSISDSRLDQTLELLTEIEECKFLVPTAKKAVRIVGVDESADAIVLVEPDRLGDEGSFRAAGISAATFFCFRDSQLQDFLARFEDPNDRLPRIRLGEAPYTCKPAKTALEATLTTYCFFWPDGTPTSPRQVNELNLLDIVRILICPGGVAYVSGTENRSIIKLLKTRDLVNRTILPGVRKMLSLEYEEPIAVLKDVESLFEGKHALRAVVKRTLARFRENSLPNIQSSCRKTYISLLFPGINDKLESLVSEHKLELLISDLELVDRWRLRRWIFGGLVLSPNGAYFLGEEQEELFAARPAVERIRQTAIQRLGIPLINWINDPPRIVLDLVPCSTA
jgi:hypothetical protein